jgi:hypothetical protein
MTNASRIHYRSYLLRFWEERGRTSGAAAWRFSLEDPLTGERHGFVSLESLMSFLQAELVVSEEEAQSPQRDDGQA